MPLFRLSVIFILLAGSIQGFAQERPRPDSSLKPINLEEVIISASNFAEQKKNVAQKIDVITNKAIANANAQNTGDLLSGTGKIFVQKSQQGGSSPVMRGFEASRVLLVVDGVRMNNAIYRSGHLQNVITTDQNILSRVEVMYGPSSTVYGSDALGGTLHLVTKSPQLSGTKKFLSTGSAFTRYSTVNHEKTVHADVSLGGPKFAWLQSYNYSDFDDLRMGSQYPKKFPDFGRRSNYINTINGVDTILVNPDDRVQLFSGYKQWDILQKLLFRPSLNRNHQLNFQYSTSTNIPRYDRLQDTFTNGANKGKLRFAEWYYGPQQRLLAAYEFFALKIFNIDEVKLNVNFQDITESRQTREYRRYDRFDSRKEKVQVYGITLNGRKFIGNHELTLGTDAQFNKVRSRASRTNLLSGEVSKLDTRYPDGKNTMNQFGFFAQHLYKFSNKKWVLNDGLRLQAVQLRSNVNDNSFFNLPDTAVKQDHFAVTGNIGIVYTPKRNTVIRASLSSAFRAPNIDDLSKIFESSTTARQVVVPNARIRPEYTYNLDLTLVQKAGEKLTIELTGFYTLFRNALAKAPFLLNGQDSIIYNGVKSQVLASQNFNRANLYGFTAGLQAILYEGLQFNSTISFTRGRYITDASKTSAVYEKQSNGTYLIVQKNVSHKPLDHIPPIIGRSGFNYQHKKFNTELFVLFNGWKRLEQFNADGEDNGQYATAEGYPGWLIMNFKAGINLEKNLLLQLGIENITDRNYRPFASGFSGGGRNFIVSLRSNW